MEKGNYLKHYPVFIRSTENENLNLPKIDDKNLTWITLICVGGFESCLRMLLTLKASINNEIMIKLIIIDISEHVAAYWKHLQNYLKAKEVNEKINFAHKIDQVAALVRHNKLESVFTQTIAVYLKHIKSKAAQDFFKDTISNAAILRADMRDQDVFKQINLTYPGPYCCYATNVIEMYYNDLRSVHNIINNIVKLNPVLTVYSRTFLDIALQMRGPLPYGFVVVKQNTSGNNELADHYRQLQQPRYMPLNIMTCEEFTEIKNDKSNIKRFRSLLCQFDNRCWLAWLFGLKKYKIDDLRLMHRDTLHFMLENHYDIKRLLRTHDLVVLAQLGIGDIKKKIDDLQIQRESSSIGCFSFLCR